MAVKADGWFLAIFHDISILCMEGVLVHDSVGEGVARMCGCLNTTGM